MAAFDSCIDKAIESKESLKGCDYFFPTPGDMFFALSYALVRGWAQGKSYTRKSIDFYQLKIATLPSLVTCILLPHMPLSGGEHIVSSPIWV